MNLGSFNIIGKAKEAWNTLLDNHPTLTIFLQTVKTNRFEAGTKITFSITYPNGTKQKVH